MMSQSAVAQISVTCRYMEMLPFMTIMDIMMLALQWFIEILIIAEVEKY
jgi:nicotinamide riboside transporter PnuC